MIYQIICVLWISPWYAFATCPTGSVQGLKDDDCYGYHESPTSWYEAEESCVRLGGHLTSVENAFQNAFLGNSWNFGSSAYWLGGSVGVTSSAAWSWTDGKPFAYANWATGQPSSTSTAKEHCLSVNLRTRLWFSTDCELNLPFICLYPPSTKVATTVQVFTCPPTPICTRPPVTKCPAPTTCPPIPPPIPCTPPPKAPPCPPGWTHLALTNKCYKYFAGGRSGPDAVTLCINNGAVLASIHSYAENSFLTDLDAADAWIGLYYDNGWRWVDGSALDYTHWRAPYPAAQGVGSACAYLVREGASPFTSYWCNWQSCDLQLGALCSIPAAE